MCKNVDHGRGLCQKPDMSKYGKAQNDLDLPREVAEADPPSCRCCGHTMRVVEMSASLDQIGMYELICDFCS